MKLKKTLDSITLKGNPGMVVYGLCLTTIVIVVLVSFWVLSYKEGINLFVAFVCTALCCSAIPFGVASVVIYSTRIKVDETGITRWSLLGKKFISWHDVKDYGITNEGSIAIGGRLCRMPASYLYFSKNQLATKKENVKIFNGYYIRIALIGNDIQQIIDEIIPYCEKRTDVERFGISYKTYN